MLITGMLLERTMKGELPLLHAIRQVTEELMSRSGSRELPEGPFGAELVAVEQARKQTLFAAGVAAQKHMQNLEQEQEVLAWLADMIIQTYAMESVVLRATNAVAHVDEEGVAARRAAARLAIETGMHIVEARRGRCWRRAPGARSSAACCQCTGSSRAGNRSMCVRTGGCWRRRCWMRRGIRSA